MEAARVAGLDWAGNQPQQVTFPPPVRTGGGGFQGGGGLERRAWRRMETIMESKHTPGPWTISQQVNKHGATVYTIGGDNNAPAGTVLPWPVASDGIRRVEDAHLIAAAPDLLEAVRALFAECAMVHKHWGENCNQKAASAAIESAKAAIAKAEGR